ncbi:SNF2 domain-containing protein CLASSY 3-like [Neltuma alba]|uniref:SNF2 domain-containing protein CLASSY 3-like n=1 Tax=Neltuma alba TaxID=207710 RepID=UPI0010A3C04A|nr:SNF2 domain-containing protein CLASSY 3-like [Prosopis alba]
MYSGTGVAGRTRSRQGNAGKPYFEDDNNHRKQHEAEEITSRDDWCSIDTVSDDEDVILIESAIQDDDNKEDIGRTQPRQAREDCDETASDIGSSDVGGSDHNGFTRSRCIARRTRSHFRASKFRNTKSGTFSNPINIDDEEKENETTNDIPIRQESLHGEEVMPLENSASSSDEEVNPKVMRKRNPKVTPNRRRKQFDGFKILPDHPHSKGVAPLEKPASSSDEEGISEVMRMRSPGVTNNERRKQFDGFEILPDHPLSEGVVPLENPASSSDEEGNPEVMRKRSPEVTPNRRRKQFDGFEILPNHPHSEGVAPLENPASSSDEEGNPEVMRKRSPEVTPNQRRKQLDGFEILPDHPHSEGVAPLENPASLSDEEGNPEVMRKRLKVSRPVSDDELAKLWAESDKGLYDCEDNDGTPEDSKLEKSEPEEEDSELRVPSACDDEAGIPEEIKPCPSSKSTSGTEASQPLEKLEAEEKSFLWAEMEDGLACEEVTPDQVDNEHCDDSRAEGEDSVAARCQRGDHVPIMNDEIGIVCKYCSHLIRDIKDCDPEFGKNPSGKSGGRYSYRSEDSNDSFSVDTEHENSVCDGKCSGFVTYAPPTGTVWDIIPRAKWRMYDHQVEAFEFLWTNLAGGTVLDELEDQLDFASGNGCIISHAPGTGKTFLTIVFLRAFMRRYPNCRPMIIAPTNILHTWEKELKKWELGDPVPFHNLNRPDLSGEETKTAMTRLRRYGGRARAHNNQNAIRGTKIFSWKESSSILGISYTLFDRLARKGSDTVKNALFELPGLLVLDEGHTPRNERSLMWEALSKVKTKRRILLSGTPFQNNFKELNNTLRLAKPRLAETKRNLEYLLKSYDRVESNSERREIVANIRDLIKPFVHVHKGTVLQERLPGLMESVVNLMPSQTQMSTFENIRRLREGREGSSNWFKFEYLMSVASVHPSLFVNELTNLPERERVELNSGLEGLESSPECGAKTRFVMDFVQQIVRMKEKVLIFSQYIVPLTFLANHIKSCFDWNEGEQMMVVHGKTHEGTRQASIDAFNDPSSKARVMLASTKACYEGINLVGASRVILLDTLWNPSAERQAVSRAYRIGQKKVVYTYRLITAGTWDEQKLYIQAQKDQLSESVFFVSDEDDRCQNMSPGGFEDKLLEKMGRKFGIKITKRGVTILLESEK